MLIMISVLKLVPSVQSNYSKIRQKWITVAYRPVNQVCTFTTHNETTQV